MLVVIATQPAVGASAQSPAVAAATGQLDAGTFHTCAVVAGSGVRCWGFSGDGQLGYANRDTIGDNEAPGSVGPVNVGAGRTVKTLSTGEFNTCALLDDDSVRCWGYGFDGQLGYAARDNVGDDEVPGSVGPVNLGAGRTARMISGSGRHSCAVLDDAGLRCWGLAETGQLGYGNTNNIGDNETPGSVGPVSFGGGRTVKAVAAGGRHTCAILDDDSVRCWGAGGNGQLGYANTSIVTVPSTVGAVKLGAGRIAKAITAGDSHTCALLDDGSVRCWGLNEDGQLGYGTTSPIGDTETPDAVGPIDFGGGRRAVAINASSAHTCAVLDDGSVRCWGLGEMGRLGYGNKDKVGDNETLSGIGPVNVGSGRTAVAVGAGASHTCARLDDGTVRCWGFADSGRLGSCNANNIGDDELPSTIAPVDLEAPGTSCAPRAAVAPGAAATPAPSPILAPVPARPAAPALADGDAAALAAEALRARSLRSCLLRTARLARRQRGVARRVCVKRFARTPGRVRGLKARAVSKTTVVLSFLAPGSDGIRGPAARSYVVKQSLRVSDVRGLAKPQTLCKGSCRFTVTRLGTTITLKVTGLLPRSTYYYSVAARDNVSTRPGRPSLRVRVTTR